MVKENKAEKNKMNPFLWFLFAIVIPIVVAVTLTIIIFAVAGVNVIDWAKEKGSNIPVISSIITTPEEENTEQEAEKVQSVMDNKDKEIQQLNQENNDLKATIERLEQDIVKLENSNTSLDSEPESEEQQEGNTVKTVSNSFKDMDNEQAALIIQNLEKDTAVSILKEVSNKVRGEILEAMDAEVAAELTQLFINSSE